MFILVYIQHNEKQNEILKDLNNTNERKKVKVFTGDSILKKTLIKVISELSQSYRINLIVQSGASSYIFFRFDSCSSYFFSLVL